MAYATSDDLERYGLPQSTVQTIDGADITAQLDAASSLADSYLRLHYKLPLSSPYPIALVEAVCRIAAFNILSVRGYNPEGDAGMIESRYQAAMKWLQDVGAGRAAPLMVTADQGGTTNAGGPFVVQPMFSDSDGLVVGSPSSRGW